MATPAEFSEAVVTAIANAGHAYAMPAIPSQTLKDALIVQVTSPTTAMIFLTYYWALYVHDGRLPFTKTSIMCWFRDPRQDPRLNAGITPARLSDLRHLSHAEFRFWVRQNRIAEMGVYGRLRRKGEPQVGPMIITKEIKTPTQASRFFENDGGMKGFGDTVGDIVGPMMSDYIMNDALKDIARLRIPFNIHIDTN